MARPGIDLVLPKLDVGFTAVGLFDDG